MADWYYATITYPSGRKVTLAHKGQRPTPGTNALLHRIGAGIEVGEPIPPEKAREYEASSRCVARGRLLGWHPQMPDAGGEDA